MTAPVVVPEADEHLHAPVRTPASVRWFVAILGALAVVATMTAEAVAPTQQPPRVAEVVVVLIALVTAGLLVLEYVYRGHADAFDHFEAALVPALFYLPPWLAVMAVGVAKAICQVVRRVQPVKAVFNVAQWTCAAGFGALVFTLLGGESGTFALAAVSVATVIAMIVNVAAVNIVLALLGVRPPLVGADGARVYLRSTTITGLVNLSFGVLLVALIRSDPWLAPLLLIPLAMLHLASRGYAVNRAEAARQRTTTIATSALHADEDLSAIAHFLSAVGNGLSREGVDLLVREGDDVEVRRWRRNDPIAAVASVPYARVGPLATALLALDRPVHVDVRRGTSPLRDLLRDAGHRDVVAVPLPTPGASGVLAIFDARYPVAVPDRELMIVVDLARDVALARERIRLVREVDAERGRTSQIVNDTRDGIVTIGEDGEVRTWNPALERITGYAAEDLVGTRNLAVLEPIDVSGHRIRFADWMGARDDPPADVLIRTKTGERRWLSCSYSQGRGEDGVSRTLIVMARDVTDLRQVEGRLAGQTAVLERIAAGEPLSVSLELLARDLAAVDDDASAVVLLVDPHDSSRLDVAAAVGVSAADLEALGMLEVGPDAGALGRAAYERGHVYAETEDVPSRFAAPAPSEVTVTSVSAVPIWAAYADRVIGVVGVLGTRPRPSAETRDRGVLERAAHLAAVAVERSEFEARLAHQATHDALTGLPNRAVLLDRCDQILRGLGPDRQVVMVFVDLDRFKLVNDSMGHDAGDKLLVEVAGRLSRVVRPGDTVARFGGDEFIVLSEGPTDAGHVVGLADRLHAALARPFMLGATEVVVSASLGVAVGEPGTGPDDLVNVADAAMYRAKEQGGNRYELYDESMREPSMLQLATHSALHHALEHGDIVAVYQPIVSLRTSRVIGVEALARWEHPDRGLVAPDEFLPLAERTGLVVPIGRRIMTLACEQAARWSRDGHPLTVNVNLSARELAQPDLAESVSVALESTGADPRSICIEITESALVRDLDAASSTMRDLKDLGVRLMIDDFGTGYAPLTYLRNFPVDGLKVDRSFVRGLVDESDDRSIVAAVISLAHALGIITTAEGVESAEQLAILRDLGCDSAQGFYLAAPGSADAIHAGEVART